MTLCSGDNNVFKFVFTGFLRVLESLEIMEMSWNLFLSWNLLFSEFCPGNVLEFFCTVQQFFVTVIISVFCL